jgi:hypothetical protein
MPTHRHDLDALLQSILRDEKEQRAPSDEEVQAALADPTLAGLVERALARYEGIFTEKARARVRRTLAVVFTTDPRAMVLLSRLRERERKDASTAVAAKKSDGPDDAAGTPERGRT